MHSYYLLLYMEIMDEKYFMPPFIRLYTQKQVSFELDVDMQISHWDEIVTNH